MTSGLAKLPTCEKESKKSSGQGVVEHAFNPSTREAEAGKFLSWRPAESIEQVPGQPSVCNEENH